VKSNYSTIGVPFGISYSFKKGLVNKILYGLLLKMVIIILTAFTTNGLKVNASYWRILH